jgi:hypothetical protein
MTFVDVAAPFVETRRSGRGRLHTNLVLIRPASDAT